MEVLVNAKRCNSLAISNPRTIELFLEDMVKRIDMKAYGRPLIKHFGEGNKSGYTAIQLIETSNISAHFCDQDGDAYLNIFSCKHFDPAVAQNVVATWFTPEWIDCKVVARQAGVKME
jgi:S-adenosylmethionine/arginine decarboxylase-like enzyme